MEGAALPAGRVVVGVDGSEGSITALAWALREARLRGAELHVIAAWSFHANWGSGPGAYAAQEGMLAGRLDPHTPSLAETDQRNEADLAAIRQMVGTAIEDALEDGEDERAVSITSDAVEGAPAKVLLDSVSASDLLVVGTRGHGAFVGALLGSVSHHVVAQAPCPVVVVPHRSADTHP